MSYILDALKKSDQERQQNNGPNLQSVHRQQPAIKAAPSKLWLLIIFLLVLIVAVAGWLFFSLPNASITVKQPQPSAPNQNIATPTANLQPQAAQTTISPTEVVNHTELMLVEFWELSLIHI